MIKIKPTRLFNTIKSNKASLVHRLPIALVLFVLMLSPFAALAQTAELTIEDVGVDEDVVGGTVEITVRLSSAVSGGVTARVTATGGTAVSGAMVGDGIDYITVDQTLTFNGNADEEETFSIRINNDNIVELNETITLSIPEVITTGVVTHTSTATVTINDDDGNATLTIDGDMSVAEAGTASLMLTLSKELSEGLEVLVNTAGGSAEAADYTALTDHLITFNAGVTVQPFSVVTLTDEIVESNETFNVSVTNNSPAGSLDGRVTLPAAATVTINDDDGNATLTIGGDMSVTEAGTASLMLTLSKELSEGLEVLVNTAGGSAEAADYTALTDHLITFNAGVTVQPFSVVTLTDEIVESNETFNVSVTNNSPAGSLDGRVTLPAAATVTINDDDGNATLTIGGDMSVTEAGTASLMLTLSKELSEGLEVLVNTAGGSAEAADYTALTDHLITFNAGVTVQPFSVVTLTDEIVESNETFNVSVTNNSPAGSLDGRVTLPAAATVTINDDDGNATLTIGGDMSVTEAGTASLMLTLSKELSEGLEVLVNTAGGSAEAADYTALTDHLITFNAGVTVQPFSVVTLTDNIVESNETFNVSVTNNSPAGSLDGRVTLPADATVTINDDDEVGITLTPSGTLNITESMTAAEDPSTATYTVALTSEPVGGDVTIQIASINTATDTDNDVTVDPSTLIFTAANWRTTQTVTITAAADDDAVNDSADLTHTATGADYTGTATTLAVTVSDPDIAGITFNPASVTILENDDMAVQEYTVILNTQPTADVTVTIDSINIATDTANDVTVNRPTLTFTADNWNTAQPVTITAADDADAVDDSVNLMHTARGGDYGTENVTAGLPVTVTDDEMAGITFNPRSITMDENARVSYTVILDSQPTTEVTVAIAISNNDITLDSQSLTFTTDNWDDPDLHTVTITEADDDDAVDDSATLTHTATGGDYGTENVTAELLVTVTDPETARILLNPASVTVDEGTTRTYTVELDTQPVGGNVTVTIENPNRTIDYNSSISVSPQTLTFSTTNWGTAQTVTVNTGTRDDDNDGYMRTFLHTAAGGDYDGLTADLMVTVTDTDPAVSQDSRLSMLTISAADGTNLDADLLDSDFNPTTFAPSTTDYVLIIDNLAKDSTDITVTAILSDADSATAELILGEVELARVDSGDNRQIVQGINLEAGRNDLQIIVTAQDNSSRVYAITVARIDQVVLNDVKLVTMAASDCNAAPVATVMPGGRYYACVERFPLDTEGMVLFDDMVTTPLATPLMLDSNSTRTRIATFYTVDAGIVPSSQTYLMMTVTVDMAVYEVRYPITDDDPELTDIDNDGIPDTIEREREMRFPNVMYSPENLLITDPAATATIRQIVVPEGHRIALGDAARRAAIAGLESSGGLTYTAELRLSTTELASIGISEPDGYNREGIYDFVVYLPTVDNVASIVIPLASPLTAGLGYMKYKDGVWDAFADDNMAYPNDKYYSAPREDMRVNNMGMPEFICPLHNDLEKWTLRMPQQPLTPGHRCILLRIEDGSPNDADGIPNGIVVDPGALASIPGGGSGGSGASDLWFILLLTLINLAVFILRRKQIASTQRK